MYSHRIAFHKELDTFSQDVIFHPCDEIGDVCGGGWGWGWWQGDTVRTRIREQELHSTSESTKEEIRRVRKQFREFFCVAGCRTPTRSWGDRRGFIRPQLRLGFRMAHSPEFELDV